MLHCKVKTTLHRSYIFFQKHLYCTVKNKHWINVKCVAVNERLNENRRLPLRQLLSKAAVKLYVPAFIHKNAKCVVN